MCVLTLYVFNVYFNLYVIHVQMPCLKHRFTLMRPSGVVNSVQWWQVGNSLLESAHIICVRCTASHRIATATCYCFQRFT